MQSEQRAMGSEEQAEQEHHDHDGQGFGGLPTKAVKRKGKPRVTLGESIHCKRFIRRLQTGNVLTALMFDIDRDTHADYQVWDLASEVYGPEELKQIFDELVQSGLYRLGRLAEELIGSFNRLRDPAPDMDFPSVAAACAAVKQEAKTRLTKGDYLWAILDPDTGRSPDRDGKGWAAMTDALLERMLSDRIPRALDMRFGRDLGL
ncbi:hypothetical protein PSE10C_51170 [Pseudomonas amygdali pv. eriobotryae]|uniref:Uncharacterized protein n=1 Tax=Pseudomonas amygdali pv. eriobotryae TaxID=129137 RepID=A0A3M3A8W9_PSEA0|nr:hypothetical protein [Pseudomonas amygdali]RML96932.1 hypothetical protein ALQ86_03478 [Pseudomonas amygdali pv. eriobotryae]GFZ74375.1 hypothetical protein PSE10C_51170 [Pseudomonas amygdali pv. eriobotryae]